jgi:hypothetical protein
VTVPGSVASHRPLRAVLDGAIDYAGLFPPAALDMASAVRNYRDYHLGADAWALGRFVLPVAGLDEFEGVASSYLPPPSDENPWQLSVIAGPDAAGDARRIAAFNERFHGVAVVDSVEARARTVEEISHLGAALRGIGATFVEIPLDANLEALVAAIAEAGVKAKVRTGGLSSEAIPAPEDVARFLRACVRSRVAFKATAGLHHPVRAEYPLTYEPGSARGTMFGYLNVFLAATLAHIGASDQEVTDALQLTDRGSVTITDDSIAWGGIAVPADAITLARSAFALGFGSCSFREPLDELSALRYA